MSLFDKVQHHFLANVFSFLFLRYVTTVILLSDTLYFLYFVRFVLCSWNLSYLVYQNRKLVNYFIRSLNFSLPSRPLECYCYHISSVLRAPRLRVYFAFQEIILAWNRNCLRNVETNFIPLRNVRLIPFVTRETIVRKTYFVTWIVFFVPITKTCLA